jgi:phenylacetate-CoA ligase
MSPARPCGAAALLECAAVAFRRAWRAFKWSLLARRDGYPDFKIDRELSRHERFSQDELAALRRDKTRALVRACLDSIPYYGDLMRAAGIDPARIEGPEELQVLPLLDKAIIRREKSRLLNRSAHPGEYHPHGTSGSTGAILEFFRGYDYERIAVAGANFRAWRRMGWQPGDALGQFWSLHGDAAPETKGLGRLRRAVRRWLEPPGALFDPFDNTPAILDGWIERIRASGPEYFYGYGTVVTLLAYHLKNRGLTLDRVRGIATTAEAIPPHARAAMQQAFPRAVIIDIYGSREVPGVSAECRLGAMHVNSDLVHIEFLEDRQAQGGSRLVLTSLDNRIFPFIRYDIGDEGSPAEKPCPCGLPFPSFRFGPGRVIDSFVMPDGRILYGGFLEDLMAEVPGVRRYQFLQKTPGEVVVFVIPDGMFGDESRAALERARRKAVEGFGAGVTLEVRLVESIPLTRSGKHLYLVSLVRNPLLARGNETAPLL